MRVVFAGTPDFAVPSLKALAQASFIEVAGVYTQPDRPSGRGKKLKVSAVKTCAGNLAYPVYQPVSFRDEKTVSDFIALKADLMIVVAYGLILPEAVLEVPRLGCVNIHASLLPRWRGAAPIQRAIEQGERTTGVTLMQMQADLDSGPVLAQSEIGIDDNDTGGSLHDKLAILGGKLLLANLSKLKDHTLNPKPQDPALVTYAKKLDKSESALDWHQSATILERKVRAYNPWPVVTARLEGIVLRILQANVRNVPSEGRTGEVMGADKHGILVKTGDGQLNLEVLQKPGGKAMPAKDFLNGMPISKGMRFDSSP